MYVNGREGYLSIVQDYFSSLLLKKSYNIALYKCDKMRIKLKLFQNYSQIISISHFSL